MATRYTTTAASGESAIWSPTDESILQIDAADATAIVEICARVDAASNWVRIDVLSRDNIFLRIPKFPFLKAIIVRNVATNAIAIRDSLA